MSERPPADEVGDGQQGTGVTAWQHKLGYFDSE
jgi:hypothetical protein